MYNTDGSVKKFEQLESTSADAKMTLIARGGPNGAIVFYTVRSNGGRKFSTY